MDDGVLIIQGDLGLWGKAFLARAQCSKTFEDKKVNKDDFTPQKCCNIYFSAVFGTVSAYSSKITLTRM